MSQTKGKNKLRGFLFSTPMSIIAGALLALVITFIGWAILCKGIPFIFWVLRDVTFTQVVMAIIFGCLCSVTVPVMYMTFEDERKVLDAKRKD